MDRVNERSTAYLSVSFRDRAGALQAPAAISYRVDDEATGAPIRAETLIAAPASEVEIVLTAADNAMVAPRLAVERHVVTVVGSYGDDDQVTAQFVYEVLNLQAVA